MTNDGYLRWALRMLHTAWRSALLAATRTLADFSLHFGWYRCTIRRLPVGGTLCRSSRSSSKTSRFPRLSQTPSQYGQMLFVFIVRFLSSKTVGHYYSIPHCLFRIRRFGAEWMAESLIGIREGVINFFLDRISDRSVSW